MLSVPKKLYYCVLGTNLGCGIRELKTQDDMEEFMVLGYQNGYRMDLYTEIYGYDVLEMLTDGNLHKDDEHVIKEDKDLSEDSDTEYVDFNTEEDDPNNDEIVAKYKIRNDVQYPSYNLDTPWKEFQAILGIKFESPKQLKLALADYGVAHGYRLWYYIGLITSLCLFTMVEM
ncbi:hypothetical protein Tco_1012615 [Tanacetum coccineum]